MFWWSGQALGYEDKAKMRTGGSLLATHFCCLLSELHAIA